MARLKLPRYVKPVRKKDGRTYYYLNRPGFPLVRLPGSPYSTAFMDAIDAAMVGQARTPIGAKSTRPGSVKAVWVAFKESADFRVLGMSTQATYRRWGEAFCEKNGDNSLAHLTRGAVQKMMDAKAATPAAANNLLRLLRMLARFALDRGMLREEPPRPQP